MSEKIERAKAAGWRIECLGDQQDGLWNWVIWSPDNGYSIQTEYPLANEAEAWDYFYGFVLGLPKAPATELAPAAPSAPDAGDRVVSPSMVADHVASGDFASVWDIIEMLQLRLEKAGYEHGLTSEQNRRFSGRLGRINIMLDEAGIDMDNGHADERIAKMLNRELPDYPAQASEPAAPTEGE